MIDDPDCDGGILCTCCGKWIRKGDRYMREVESALCEPCAPTFQHLLDEPDGGFVNGEGEPLTPDECRTWYDHHIDAGGKPTDSMATEIW